MTEEMEFVERANRLFPRYARLIEDSTETLYWLFGVWSPDIGDREGPEGLHDYHGLSDEIMSYFF